MEFVKIYRLKVWEVLIKTEVKNEIGNTIETWSIARFETLPMHPHSIPKRENSKLWRPC